MRVHVNTRRIRDTSFGMLFNRDRSHLIVCSKTLASRSSPTISAVTPRPSSRPASASHCGPLRTHTIVMILITARSSVRDAPRSFISSSFPCLDGIPSSMPHSSFTTIRSPRREDKAKESQRLAGSAEYEGVWYGQPGEDSTGGQLNRFELFRFRYSTASIRIQRTLKTGSRQCFSGIYGIPSNKLQYQFNTV